MRKVHTRLLRKFLIMVVPLAVSAQADVEKFTLDNGTIAVEITPDIGGRVLSARLHNQVNFLRVGEAVTAYPTPDVSPESRNIPYFGHEVWVGPQSQWWVHQLLNDERRAAKAIWPPDPYLVLARHQSSEKNSQHIVLRSPNSPISGVNFTKRYSLVAGNPNQIKLDVEAKNIRDTNVSWDIWYNTRVPHSVDIYVPVAAMDDVRIAHFSDEHYDGLQHTFSDGFFSVDNNNSVEKQGRKGKIFIQPSEGWMAAFSDTQVFIIQFALQPRSAIHPEQGQIELYQEFLNKSPELGLLELEVHAPYKTLMPGETMAASETWTILPYQGESTRGAHVEFLKKLNLSK